MGIFSKKNKETGKEFRELTQEELERVRGGVPMSGKSDIADEVDIEPLDDELTEDELDEVRGGVHTSNKMLSDIANEVNTEPTADELTEDELDKVTAGVPVIDDDKSL